MQPFRVRTAGREVAGLAAPQISNLKATRNGCGLAVAAACVEKPALFTGLGCAPNPASVSQIARLVMGGSRPTIPPPSELPGPDTESFASSGLDAYCQLIR